MDNIPDIHGQPRLSFGVQATGGRSSFHHHPHAARRDCRALQDSPASAQGEGGWRREEFMPKLAGELE